MNRTFSLIWIMLLSGLSLCAQDADRYIFASRDIAGTARYVSMGGAFAALGGDVSAVADNPAALGVFRRGELSVTIDWQRAVSRSEELSATVNRLRLPQVSWVFGFGDTQRQSGMLFNNFILQYQRLKTYNKTSLCAGYQPLSQTDLIANLTNGLSPAVLASGDDVWNNTDVGWLSVMGYDCGVIESDTNSTDYHWYSVLQEGEQVLSSLRIAETGSVDSYTFAWGTNISNRFYLGLSCNMLTLSYTKKTGYAEQSELGSEYEYVSTFAATGIGVNLGVGAILRPLQWLRVGLAVQTPTWMTLNLDDYVNYLDVQSPVYSPSIEHYQLPMQTVAGLAFQFATNGLLSLEYDWRHQADGFLPDEHTMKVGGEYVLKNNWFLHAGYAFRSSFGRADFSFEPSAFDTRTDTEFRNPQSVHYASVGAGFRNRTWIVDIAYQFCFERTQTYAHAYQPHPFMVDNSTHRIVCSFGWTRRR